jgi:hypothetical protein
MFPDKNRPINRLKVLGNEKLMLSRVRIRPARANVFVHDPAFAVIPKPSAASGWREGETYFPVYSLNTTSPWISAIASSVFCTCTSSVNATCRIAISPDVYDANITPGPLLLSRYEG